MPTFTPSGSRSRSARDVIVDAAVESCASGKEISFLVDSDQEGGRIERFHLHVDL